MNLSEPAIGEIREMREAIRYEEKVIVRTIVRVLTLQRGGATTWEIRFFLDEKLSRHQIRVLLGELEAEKEVRRRGKRSRGVLWVSC